ncbi:MAG: SdpI family protein [Pseudomonadota bacterium]
MIRKGLTWALAPIVVLFAFAVWGWISVDPGAEIAVHWGLDGQVNRTGGRLEAFAMLPLMGLGLTALCAILPSIDPRGANIRRAPALYLTAWIGTLWVLAVGQGALTLAALERFSMTEDMLVRLVLAATALLLVFTGNVMSKARSNWFAGVRTPWTLSSDRAWDVSHRWAGRILVIGGLVSLIAALAGSFALVLSAVLATSLGGALIPAVISYFVWRDDPERETFTPSD